LRYDRRHHRYCLALFFLGPGKHQFRQAPVRDGLTFHGSLQTPGMFPSPSLHSPMPPQLRFLLFHSYWLRGKPLAFFTMRPAGPFFLLFFDPSLEHPSARVLMWRIVWRFCAAFFTVTKFGLLLRPTFPVDPTTFSYLPSAPFFTLSFQPFPTDPFPSRPPSGP